jgi:acyl-[acyl-carrier-protein]-phospholipid O-acyltransferase/long-chain-fatty-acid--[acyl-carrier-protein] ligase
MSNQFLLLKIKRLLPASFGKSIVKWILKVFYKVDVRGFENYLNLKERTLIIANHASFLDAAIIYAFLPGKLTFAVDKNIVKKLWIRPFLKLVDTYPVNPTNPVALKKLINLVKEGKKVVIFPEESIAVTEALMKIYKSSGMIADKADAEILPIIIDGVQYSKFSRLKGEVKKRWFPKVSLKILKPQKIELDKSLLPRQKRSVAGSKLHDVMVDMIFESSNYNKTIFQSLLEAKDTYGSKHIIAEDINFTPISYKNLIMKSFILGNYTAKFTDKNDLVGILMPNSIAATTLFFGLHSRGRVPVMLNFSAGLKNIVSACKTSQLKYVYTSKTFIRKAKLKDVTDALKKNKVKIIYLETLRKKIGITQKLLGVVAGKFPKLFYKLTNFKNINAEKPATVMFTSGSEGAPKGVVLSHMNIQSNIYQMNSNIDFNSQDTVFNVLPLFHSFGLTAGMILPVLSGIKLFLYPSPLHYKIIPELICKTNSTIVFGTNTFLDRYAKYADSRTFCSLRYVFAGAEKLNEATKNLWKDKFGIRVFEGYGTTETSPVISVNTPMKNRFGSVGKILPGMKYELEKVPGIEIGGKLIVSGPNIMLGYMFADKPGEIIPPKNNKHDTGDIVKIDDEGYITIKGRVKRFAKIAGEMISMPYVESEISKFLTKNVVAVVSKPDEKKGERLILVTDKPDVNLGELMSFLRESGMSELAIPKNLFYLEEIPLLGTGKIDYVKLGEVVV